VPISHSINFYNKVIDDFDKQAIKSKVSDEMQRQLISRRYFTGYMEEKKLGDREIILQNSYKDKVRLNIFEGGHEMIEAVALEHIPSLTILTLGDSNGEMQEGWINQLKTLRFNDLIVNQSISGNTNSFDNLNSEKINSLKYMHCSFSNALSISGKIDIIILYLSTNDCKTLFKDHKNELPEYLDSLLAIIKEFPYANSNIPEVYVVSLPPMGPDLVPDIEYIGGPKQLLALNKQIQKISLKRNCHFVDIYNPLSSVFPFVSNDGVHLTSNGQYLIAGIINRAINFREP
jgi:lysophospholipase L1-like esterase